MPQGSPPGRATGALIRTMARTGGCCGVFRVSMTTSHKIMIAEDNLPGAELLEAYLAETPYDTRLAHNGEDALIMRCEVAI